MEIIRIRKVSDKRRAISFSKEKEIAELYHFKKVKIKHIAERLKLDPKMVSDYARAWRVKPKIPRRIDRLTNDEQKDKCLMIVNIDDLEFLGFLMAEYRIDFSVPQTFTFEERFESSINPETMVIKDY